MRPLEHRIKMGLAQRGIQCHSIFEMSDVDETRILLAFKSKDNNRLTTRRLRNVLESLNVGNFRVPTDFSRLSATFLHLEISMGTRQESKCEENAE